MLGMGPAPAPGEEDYDLINAGKQPVTLLPGGAYFHHADSLRDDARRPPRHLRARRVPGVGDAATSPTGTPARRTRFRPSAARWTSRSARSSVYVMMEHLTKSGESKIVERCTYPLTGIGCVNRIYTDLAVLDVTPRRPRASSRSSTACRSTSCSG